MVVHDVARYLRVQRPWRFWDEARLRQGLGVYVHIPFCLARCGYCDFLTFGESNLPAGLEPATYTELLLSEIKLRGALATELYEPHGRTVDSVFIGGGTPTYLTSEQLAGIIEAICQHFPLAERERIEFTVEANPDTLDATYLTALAEAGVNRLSVGVQATQPEHLSFLERTHSWRGILPVLDAIATGPIKRYSFDLIYGVPGLSNAEVRASIRRLMQYHPEHISAYELTSEKGTPYHAWACRHPGKLATSEGVVAQQRTIQRTLGEHGLYRYEVSNYARPGRERFHNLRYWRGGDYFGLGLGAASRIGTEVLNNPRTIGTYREAATQAGTSADPLHVAWQTAYAVSQDTAPPADGFLRLRTRLGLSSSAGRPRPDWVKRGWVVPTPQDYEVTADGLNFAELMAREWATH